MKYIIQLSGMHCEACTKITRKRLEKILELTVEEVGFENQKAVVNTSSTISQKDIVVALKDLEYQVLNLEEVK